MQQRFKLVAVLLACTGAQPLHAVTRTWNTSTSGSYVTATNWSPAAAPGSADTALFRRGEGVTYTTTFPGRLNLPLPVYALDRVRIGNNAVTFADTLGLGQAPGTMTITNPTTALAGRGLVVGESDIDTAAVLTTSLANLSAAAVLLGDAPEASGTLNVTGGTLTITGASAVDDELVIGKQGYGELSISSGGRVNLAGAQGSVATSQLDGLPTNADLPQSMIRVSGAGSQLNVGGVLTLGLSERSDMTIEDGGLLTTGWATVVMSGGIGSRKSSRVFVEGVGSRWENAGDLSLGVAGDLDASGGMAVRNGGSVAVGGALTTYSSLVGVNGTVEGNVINRRSVFAGSPNQGFGSLHITGNYEQLSASNNNQSYLYVYGISSASPGKLRVDGDITLDPLKSRLSVHGTGDPLLDQFNLGDSFDLLDWNGALTGAFNAVTLPALPSFLNWNTSDLYITGVIRVVQFYAADFDNDGDVDQADYTIWKDAYGPSPLGDANGDNVSNAADYTIWRDTLGSASSLPSVAIPEPATGVLLILALTSALPLCRRRLQEYEASF